MVPRNRWIVAVLEAATRLPMGTVDRMIAGPVAEDVRDRLYAADAQDALITAEQNARYRETSSAALAGRLGKGVFTPVPKRKR